MLFQICIIITATEKIVNPIIVIVANLSKFFVLKNKSK